MGILRRPSYYKDFKCIASACTDSCCQDWEIDVDEDTLAYYMSVKGEFGDRLKKNIAIPEDEQPHFIQTENERCPFLNSEGLCDIFINLGEEHLSQICTHHPRYYDWLEGVTEAGLGLCCEEAVRLVLKKTDQLEFEIIEDETDYSDRDNETWSEDFDGETSEYNSNENLEVKNSDENDVILADDDNFEMDLQNKLFEMREGLFEIIKSENNLDAVMNALSERALEYQDCYDDFMFGEVEEEDDLLQDESAEENASAEENVSSKESASAEENVSAKESASAEENVSAKESACEEENVSEESMGTENMEAEMTQLKNEKFVEHFWKADNLRAMIDFFKHLEINDMTWWKTLEELEANVDKLIASKKKFEAFYEDKMYEYQQLLIYFVYRHFMKSRFDDMVFEKVAFAVISVSVIELLGINEWLKTGKLEEVQQVNVCKLYSKEIEYDEDNTEKVSMMYEQEEF